MKTRLYVGSYTFPDRSGNQSKGIYVYDFNTETGDIELLQTVSDTLNPSFLNINVKNRHLYAVSEGHTSSVASYQMDDNGYLTFVNAADCEGSGMCHVVSTNDAKALYTAQYGSGHVSAVEISPDGSLGKVMNNIAHHGSGINPRRQEHQHAHSVTVSPDGKYAYACDLGMDKIMIYRIGEDGSLSANDPAYKLVAPGEGPRHMEFAPNGKDLYLVTEMGAKVIVYTYKEADGSLEAKQTVATLPEGYNGKPNTAADIHLTKDGKYLYMSNRGIDQLVCFKVIENGLLEKLCAFSSVGGFPRSFALSPDNRFVAVGNQDGTLDILKRDEKTGECTGLIQKEIPLCVCVKFFTL